MLEWLFPHIYLWNNYFYSLRASYISPLLMRGVRWESSESIELRNLEIFGVEMAIGGWLPLFGNQLGPLAKETTSG